MSYTRKYNETVSDSVTMEISDFITQSFIKEIPNAAIIRRTKTETVNIPIEVKIHVDTDPFDESVQNCDNDVDLLTTAVVATEAAEIISIEKNSDKVADTIVGGFFSYIRSEISQQIAELSQSVDSHLMHLKELAQACLNKKNQMEGDFYRISGRYIKIFDDLNNELSNRVYELDKPTFVFKKETDSQKIRTSDNDLVNTVAIFGLESSELQSKISTSIAKKRALDSINQSKLFLWQQKNLNTTIQRCMLSESKSGSIFAPVLFVETTTSPTQTDKSVFTNEFLSTLNENARKNELLEYFSSGSLNWEKLSPDDSKAILLYFNNELNAKSSENDPHSVRVREMIQQMTKISSINTINF